MEVIQGVVSLEDSNLNHYEQKTRRSKTVFATKKNCRKRKMDSELVNPLQRSMDCVKK